MRMRKQGFTLVELLVVILILGVLLLFAAVQYSKYIEYAEEIKYLTSFAEHEKELIESQLKGRLPNVYPVNALTLGLFKDKDRKEIREEEIMKSPEVWKFVNTAEEKYSFFIGQKEDKQGNWEYYVFSAQYVQTLVPWAMVSTTDGWSDCRHLDAQDGYAGVFTIDGDNQPAYTIRIYAMGVRDVKVRTLGENPSFSVGVFDPELVDGEPTGSSGSLEFRTAFSRTPRYFVVTLVGDTVEEHLVICKNLFGPGEYLPGE